MRFQRPGIRLLHVLPLLLILPNGARGAAQHVTSAPSGFRATSSHYTVIGAVSKASADAAARLLEAAWPLWKTRFGAEPRRVRPDGRLLVRIFRTRAALARRVAADLGVKTGNVLGWTDWRTGDVYAVHHALPYERRRILLHEGTHQFHYLLAAPGDGDPYPFWYAEGVAHDCERHTWSEGVLELMRPRSPQTADVVELALASTKMPLWRMDAYLERGGYARGADERSMAWALVRFYRTGASGRFAPLFAQLEERFRKRADRIGLIRSSQWGEKELEVAFLAWLKDRIPRAGRLRGEWSADGGDHTALFAPHHLCLEVLSPRPAREPGRRVGFRFSRSLVADEQVGFVLGLQSPRNNTLAWFDGQGRFHVCSRRLGRYGAVRSFRLTARAPAAGDPALMILDEAGRLDVLLRGKSILPAPVQLTGHAGGAGLYAGVSGPADGAVPAHRAIRRFTFRGVSCSIATP